MPYSNCIRVCGCCDKTDGMRYMSDPPQVRCTLTGKFRLYGDYCTEQDKPDETDPYIRISELEEIASRMVLSGKYDSLSCGFVKELLEAAKEKSERK